MSALYNCDPSLRPAQFLEPAHASVHSHIFETLSAVKPDHALPDPRAAFDELLSKVRASYEGGGSTVESFDPARVSLPPLARPPVQLGAVLGGGGDPLEDPEKLLVEEGVFLERVRESGVCTYQDQVLRRSPKARREFFGHAC